MFSRWQDKLLTLTKARIDHARYKYYYPIVERLSYNRNVKEADRIFQKNIELNIKKQAKIPFFSNSKHNKVFQDFCRNGINEFGFEKNKTALCIVLGSSEIGKSTFLRYNLQRLMHSKERRVEKDEEWYNISSLNCGAFKLMNFDIFLHHFESLLVESIRKQLSKVRDRPALFLEEGEFNAISIIREVLYDLYAPEFLNIYARDMLQAIINNEDIAVMIPDEIKPTLSDIFRIKMLEEGSDFSLVFEEVVQIISKVSKHDDISAALAISISLLSRIEYENRAPELKDSFSRTGILVNSFLFDLLNYLEGFHRANKTATQFAQNIVVLENFDSLFKGYAHDIRFYNFQDHLLLRLYSVGNERDHFPVVIESSNSRFFTKELYEMMHAGYITYGCIEIYGIPQEQLPEHLNSLFSTKEVNLLKQIIGSNPSTWASLLESFGQTKCKSAQSRVEFEDILGMRTGYFEKEYVKFKSKLESIYLDNTLADLLDGIDKYDKQYCADRSISDSGQGGRVIRFSLLNILETFVYNFGTIQVSGKYAEHAILENPVINALLSANVLYARYYYSYMMFDRFVYLAFSKRYIKEVRSSMSRADKFSYWKWCRRNGIEKNSVLLLDVSGLKLYDEPENLKYFTDFKVEAEHLQYRGIEFEVGERSFTHSLLHRFQNK